MEFPSHGANYKSLYERFRIPMPEEVYDLSENVNAFGFPSRIKEAWPDLLHHIAAYPHPEAEPFRTLLAAKLNVAKEQVLIGNGAAELLTFFAGRFSNRQAIIVHPTFSEYRSTLEAQGAKMIELMAEEIATYKLPLEQIKEHMKDAACLYLCNPNNPTGSLIPKETIEELLIHGEKVECELLVDEAFMDWTDESESVIPLVEQYPRLTVMRSMTKMYGIAGIRLGYLVGRKELVEELQRRLPHWHVNGLAIKIGQLCLEDETFRNESIERHQKIKRNLEHYLLERNCKMTDSVTNFLCFQLQEPEKTRDFYFYCLKKGVVLRHTENFRGMDGRWLRIGMKGEDAMKKFQQVMDEWYGK
ncbi:aminotransferase class I/II-fold pyridoxal phosphate-dependent enzyme [Ureibacillus terrenus]|uniref:pyridoxal phosphate-dependent aminotransferase n=1 Tax=Ureibacillus terrenus TaxID=118246 RepID=UPI002E23964D|nr:aminotransferase class I/II-fold pyridoxal phosphate-dependent enzyme [Ureibacillus terrenus]